MKDQPETMDVEVFRAGDYGAKGVYTEDDLRGIAESYDPATHEAPVTFDHEQSGPAHGWVAGVRCIGSRLVATLTRLSPTLVDAVRSHRFRKRSVELYRRFGATNGPYLKAVSFLGAAAPEVKGLADPFFTEPEAEVLRFEEEPRPDPREELVKRGVWKPEWEDAGLLRVFAALPTEDAAALVAILSASPRPVAFGATPTIETPHFAELAHDLHGEASAESAARHRAALEAMRTNPGITYREALLALR